MNLMEDKAGTLRDVLDPADTVKVISSWVNNDTIISECEWLGSKR